MENITVQINRGNGMETVFEIPFSWEGINEAKAVALAWGRDDDQQASIYIGERLYRFSIKTKHFGWMI